LFCAKTGAAASGSTSAAVKREADNFRMSPPGFLRKRVAAKSTSVN
jgi:hypothetical protein